LILKGNINWHGSRYRDKYANTGHQPYQHPVWATLIKFGFIMRIAAQSRVTSLQQQRINREI
jgi:hypothetical protein